MSLSRKFLTGAALSGLLLLSSCQQPPGDDDPPPTRSDLPNILILVLDACRADRMGSYGYERETTPAIDALASDPDATLFRRHYVQGTWTKPSTASLFSGLFIFQHGLVDDPQVHVSQVLDERFTTMAERLDPLGFYTFGIVKSQHLLADYGFAQGFDDYYPPKEVRSDRSRVKKTLELIGDATRPFVGYVHLNACHHPFPEKNRNSEILERYGIDYDEEARAAAGIDFTSSKIKYAIAEDRVRLTDEDVTFLSLIYDSVMRRADQELVRPLIEGLKELGHYDDTMIVLTADHGEALYEHGAYAHGPALWDEVIRVPLIVKFPKGSDKAGLGKQVDGVTQSIDLLPSLLAFLDLPTAEELPGTNIFGAPPRGFAYSENTTGWALIEERYKLIVADETHLFDIVADPTEQRDLAAENPDIVEGLKGKSATLRQYVKIKGGDAPSIETTLDDQALEQLRSLGYIE